MEELDPYPHIIYTDLGARNMVITRQKITTALRLGKAGGELYFRGVFPSYTVPLPFFQLIPILCPSAYLKVSPSPAFLNPFRLATLYSKLQPHYFCYKRQSKKYLGDNNDKPTEFICACVLRVSEEILDFGGPKYMGSKGMGFFFLILVYNKLLSGLQSLDCLL